jgi:hypothetical protein
MTVTILVSIKPFCMTIRIQNEKSVIEVILKKSLMKTPGAFRVLVEGMLLMASIYAN